MMRARRIVHDVKCWPDFFIDVAEGSKTFEIRVNDRDYREGDGIRPRCWSSADGYTGDELVCRIGTVLPLDPDWMPVQRVVFSLLAVSS